jgi:serine/threonine protein phosphatase 1
MPRLIAIGDIHGCLAAFDALLEAIAPAADDTLVALGDYVDRGPDVRGVIDRLIELSSRCRLVPLLGNHDQMMLDVCDGELDLLDDWLLFGGDATAASYGGRPPGNVPGEHLDFLRRCPLYHETRRHFFVHGNYEAARPLAEQSPDVLMWESLRVRLPGPHVSGKTAVVGHTSQKDGEVLDLGYLKCIDTYVYGAGWLTALEVETGRLWQADKHGRLRRPEQGAVRQ